jgi:hypothetical protein
MLGIQDPWVLTAYLLCIGCALLCVGWGIWKRNSADEPESDETVRNWAKEEDKVEEEL